MNLYALGGGFKTYLISSHIYIPVLCSTHKLILHQLEDAHRQRQPGVVLETSVMGRVDKVVRERNKHQERQGSRRMSEYKASPTG